MDFRNTDGFADPDDVVPVTRPSIVPWLLLAVTLLGGVAAAVLLWLRVGAAELQATRAGAALEEATAQKAELAERLEKLEADKADLLALRNELYGQVQAKDEELQKLQGTYEQLEAKMKEEIEKGDVRLSKAGGRIKVDLVDEILFDVGDASISTRGGDVLSRVGAVLAVVQDRKIQVSGHTDDLNISERLVDRYPTNWELAAARATNVVRYLEEKGGVSGRRLVAAAYGPWEPISSNRTASGRARNRRIEILLTPALAPAPIDDPALPAAAVAAAKPAVAKAAGAKASAAKAPAAKPAVTKVSAPAKKRTRR